tara:strand:- start:34 stop:393 length:360 start_codon:yes stop_codon:yes gene_type:complete
MSSEPFFVVKNLAKALVDDFSGQLYPNSFNIAHFVYSNLVGQFELDLDQRRQIVQETRFHGDLGGDSLDVIDLFAKMGRQLGTVVLYNEKEFLAKVRTDDLRVKDFLFTVYENHLTCLE